MLLLFSRPLYLVLLAVFTVVMYFLTRGHPEQLISFGGLICLVLFTFLFSKHPRHVSFSQQWPFRTYRRGIKGIFHDSNVIKTLFHFYLDKKKLNTELMHTSLQLILIIHFSNCLYSLSKLSIRYCLGHDSN